MTGKIKDIAGKAVFAALLAAALVPLAVVEGLGHPFLTGRELLLRIAVALALPAAAVAYGVGRRSPRTPIGWAALAVVAAAAASTVFSVDPWNSFWGFPERFGGLVSIICYAIFGFLLTLQFRERGRRSAFLYVWGGVWAAVALLAIYERTLVGPWIQFHGAHGRVISTVGNPIFLAAGMTIAGSTSIAALLAMARSRRRDAAVAMAAALCATTLLFTETRGAYVGVAAGAVTVAVALAFWSRRRVAVVGAVATISLLAIGTVSLVAAKDSSFVRSNVFLNRAASVFRGEGASSVQRFQLWSIALKAFAARPVTGWGLENFDTALDRNYDPDFTRYGVANSYSDRAHDAYLDVAVAAGALGLLAYLGLLAAIASSVIRARRDGPLNGPSAAVALGGLVAYAVQNVFAFDSQVTVLGLAVASAALVSLRPDENGGDRPSSVPTSVALLVASAFAVPLVAYGTVPLARGSVAVHGSTLATTGKELSDAADAIAASGNPYRAAQEHRIANDIFKSVGDVKGWDEGTSALVSKAESLLRDAIGRSPGKFAYRFTLGNVFLAQAVHGERPYEDAIAAFEDARKLAPMRQISDYQLGNMALVRGEPEEAVAAFRRALDMAPGVPESRWYLARALYASGDKVAANVEFKVSVTSGFRNDRTPQEYSAAIDSLLVSGDLDMVRLVYRAWARLDPGSADVLAGLATTDAELGRKAEALAAVKRALEIDPTLGSEVPAFLAKYGYSERDLAEADVTALNLQNDD